LKLWLDGTIWKTEMKRREATRMMAEDIDDKESKPCIAVTEEGAARTTSP